VNITCDAKRLQLGLSIARSIKRKTTLPATEYLSIVTSGDRAFLRATNLETSFSLDLQAIVVERGEALVHNTVISNFVRNESRRINISTEGRKVTIGVAAPRPTREGCLSISASPDEWVNQGIYTHMKEDDRNSTIRASLPSNFSVRAKYALTCVSKEDCRPILTGVLFEFSGKKLSMVTVDGFRLIVVTDNVVTNAPFEAVVPAAVLQVVARFMPGNINMSYAKDAMMASFETHGLIITTRTIQGTYPRYEQLIPRNAPAWCVTTSAPLLHRRLKQLPDSDSGIVRLQNKGNDSIRMWMSADETIDCEGQIPAVMNGDGKIAINRAYMMSFAAIFSEMSISITNTSSPVVITGDLDGVMAVIMPMFVQWGRLRRGND